ncbi:MAG: winged helix-turn-helix transcriptional regulator [Anaerolineae bacterium]|nr:winged helix-turn-helix transcriptional regulator [Anaerolineae bacterium]
MPSIRKTTGQVDTDIFTAIAHPVRRQILDTLMQSDLSVTALSAPFDISRSAISQHLSILLDSGLVVMEKRGREHLYHLRPENLNEVARWISQYEHFWQQKLDALGEYLDQMAAEDAQEGSA